jgi:hypothetical protein
MSRRRNEATQRSGSLLSSARPDALSAGSNLKALWLKRVVEWRRAAPLRAGTRDVIHLLLVLLDDG